MNDSVKSFYYGKLSARQVAHDYKYMLLGRIFWFVSVFMFLFTITMAATEQIKDQKTIMAIIICLAVGVILMFSSFWCNKQTSCGYIWFVPNPIKYMDLYNLCRIIIEDRQYISLSELKGFLDKKYHPVLRRYLNIMCDNHLFKYGKIIDDTLCITPTAVQMFLSRKDTENSQTFMDLMNEECLLFDDNLLPENVPEQLITNATE